MIRTDFMSKYGGQSSERKILGSQKIQTGQHDQQRTQSICSRRLPARQYRGDRGRRIDQQRAPVSLFLQQAGTLRVPRRIQRPLRTCRTRFGAQKAGIPSLFRSDDGDRKCGIPDHAPLSLYDAVP